jgi:hypothetical protein
MAKNILDSIKEIVESEYKVTPVIIESKSTISVQFAPPYDKKRLEIGQKLIDKLPSHIKNIAFQKHNTGKKLSGYPKYFIATVNGQKKNIEIKEFKEGDSRQTPFAPAQVQAGGKKIVNTWLTVNQFINITKTHISGLKIPETDKKTILEMIDDCLDNSYTIRYNGNKKLIPSEFFEILSSVKLATLLDNRNPKAFVTFGMPKNIKVDSVHIYIPQASNYPLTDYEISINGAHLQSSKKTERSTLKISVKSKVSSPKTNTVKFTDVFDTKQDVEKWRKRYGNDQRVQGEIAKSGLSFPSGKKSYFPLDAIGKVIDHMNVSMDSTTKSALKKVSDLVYTVKDPRAIFVYTHYGLTEKENVKLKEFLNTYVGKKRGTTDEVPYTILNIEVACEKFFEKESDKGNRNNDLNFYQMFYDKVLQEKKIAYSVAKVDGNKITLGYYSLVNWKSEYSDWVALRSKNSVGLLNDTMGLDL